MASLPGMPPAQQHQQQPAVLPQSPPDPAAANPAATAAAPQQAPALPTTMEVAADTPNSAAGLLQQQGMAGGAQGQREEQQPQQLVGEGVAKPPPQLRIVLQNVTASVNMGIRVDCASLAYRVKNAEYNHKKLPACVMRIREPKATGLVFASGKVVVTGATGVQAARIAAKKFVGVVDSLSSNATVLNFTVQNMVATVETGFPINLELLAYSQARWCMYEPELFPGVIYQTARKGLVAHIFSSGRVVLTGAKTEEHLNEALPHLLPILQQYRQQDALPPTLSG